MSDPKISLHPPKKILLGTDLSARGDRALDRAAQLARQWDAELLVVHALDRKAEHVSDLVDPLPSWRQSPSQELHIQKQIRRDLREEVAQLKIHIEEGDPAQVILDTAAREGCELIVLGMARDELFGRTLLGSTVEYLLRKSPVSVLVVKTRPNGSYQHVLVGTDFTEESRWGLEVAAHSFPSARLTLMHSFEMPYRALLSDSTLSHQFAAMERATIAEFVRDTALPEQVRARLQTTIEHGPPGLMLRRFVEEQHSDLTVIGAYGRGFLFHLFVGGNTPRIVDSVPGDILLVRAHREKAG
ncbi:nucleotide-binding universal stress UspA family protein [Roseimicrobium gellanilyticum]|uniref:Nucleotide-binding universal stress UspA family protein n=2 Tax=Roseimicrobium gellanilyticum TaxID=748857 RepID=A0A366HM86_9BACT|nr:universal stress protein [Roseimicrobium gellanilyticum]RBP44262.1 nucleotide-binding universal stress UspA family protein [Roseimicrobium gellanilyticum]